MLYQLCQIFHCEIEDVVANAGILTLPNIFPSLASSTGFYIFRFYHIFFRSSIVAAVPVKRSFPFMRKHKDDGSKISHCRHSAAKCNHKMNIKCHLSFRGGRASHLRDAMECAVNIDSIFSFKVYFCWDMGHSKWLLLFLSVADVILWSC